jgi:hypothetical protein
MFGVRSTPRRGGGPIRGHPLVDETGQSYGRLRLAGRHAATDVATAVGRLRSTTSNAISPLYNKIREAGFREPTTERGTSEAEAKPRGSRKETRMTKRKNRWGLVGLLAAGAALGAFGAMFARRRRAASAWNEYAPGVDDIGFADMHADPGSRLATTTKKVAAGAAAVAETVSAQAGRIAETLHERTAGPSGSGESGPTATTQVFSSPPSGASSPAAASASSPTSAGGSSLASASSPASAGGSPASGASGDPTPGATDETARALAGRTPRRGPFSSFANSDET